MKIGKFQVVEQLGTGAHSSILQIRRQEDGRNYALKIVPIDGPDDHKFLDQAEHEFRVAQMLSHPNLIRIHALEIEKDWLFRPRKAQLLIEYVNGKTLDTGPRLKLPMLVQVFENVASALAHMHRRNVFHGDLKPNNILLSRAGEVKVIDFGLAAIRGEAKFRVQGTPEYMAPEQIRNKVIDEKTDLYNFGATMYRMLTLRLPPNLLTEGGGLTIDAKLWKSLLKPTAEMNRAAPPALCDLVDRCLSFQASQRPERASDVHETLEMLANQLIRNDADRLESLEWN